jgi:hypothetical protein
MDAMKFFNMSVFSRDTSLLDACPARDCLSTADP